MACLRKGSCGHIHNMPQKEDKADGQTCQKVPFKEPQCTKGHLFSSSHFSNRSSPAVGGAAAAAVVTPGILEPNPKVPMEATPVEEVPTAEETNVGKRPRIFFKKAAESYIEKCYNHLYQTKTGKVYKILLI